MPITLQVGLAQKVGQPDYGSLGASCQVEVELDGSLLRDDLDQFHAQVKTAFVACRQAVQDELARHQAGPHPPRTDGSPLLNGQGLSNGSSNGHPVGTNGHGEQRIAANGTRRSTSRKATISQVRALRAIAGQQGLDLERELRSRYRVARRLIAAFHASDLGTSAGGIESGLFHPSLVPLHCPSCPFRGLRDALAVWRRRRQPRLISTIYAQHPQENTVSARHKINSLILCGILAIAGVIGLVSGSGWAFAIATTGLLIAGSASGDIRVW